MQLIISFKIMTTGGLNLLIWIETELNNEKEKKNHKKNHPPKTT